MNAPETMKPATQPISLAHKVLLKSDDALCAEEIACAILGVDKPSKIDIKSVTKQLKQLADLGMIEMEPRAGGVPFYRLIAAPVAESSGVVIPPPPEYAPAANAQRDEFTLLGLIADIRAAAGDPTGKLMQDELVQHIAAVVKERDDLRERMEGIAEAIRAGTIPDLENVTGAEDLAPHVKTLCDALAVAEIVVTGRGHTIDGLRLEVADLRERLDGVTQQSIADTVALTEKNARLAADLEDMTRERDLLKAENLALKTLEGSMPGFGAEHQEQRINSLTTDVINTRNALTNTINEADRLRAELAAERQAREALQKQSGVIQAAGYIVRAGETDRTFRLLSSARREAERLARRRIGRVDVLALVPAGSAKRVKTVQWRDA